jgi:two-component system, chemotaxis family, chemotaxis protein CheY
MKILLIEDDELIAKILAHHLTETGHQVVFSQSGETAFDLFVGHNIELIISDIMMPHNSGITAIKKIQSLPEYNTPVIIISGIENSDHYLANRGVQYHTFIQKPFKIDALFGIIEEVETSLVPIKR